MAKRIIAILQRHGDTEANDGNLFRSRLDPPLNDKGQKQAEEAAKFIADNYKVHRIVTSPMLRAYQTAEVISSAVGVPVMQDRSLFSWNLGFLSGKDKDAYEFILDSYVDNPEEVIPEGESLDQFEQRIYDFFNKELHDTKEDSVTVYVTHTSDIIAFDNIAKGNRDGRPETGEEMTEPGGVVAVWETDDGYETEVVHGKSKQAEFGS